MTATVRVASAGRVVTITIDRPPLNILDLATNAGLAAALEELAGEPALQLVVLRGAGGRAFSAGVAVEDHAPATLPAMLERFHRVLRQLVEFPLPTLAVVDGHCLGGGMELAAACDLVLGSDRARFGQPEIKLGCFPPAAAALYPSLLGAARTFELLLTGRTLDAAEAERIGFLTWRVPPEDLEEKLASVTAEITAQSAAVIRLTTRAIRAGKRLPFAAALGEAERIYLEELASTADMDEGIAAFLAKRPPAWSHH